MRQKSLLPRGQPPAVALTEEAGAPAHLPAILTHWTHVNVPPWGQSTHRAHTFHAMEVAWENN